MLRLMEITSATSRPMMTSSMMIHSKRPNAVPQRYEWPSCRFSKKNAAFLSPNPAKIMQILQPRQQIEH